MTVQKDSPKVTPSFSLKITVSRTSKSSTCLLSFADDLPQGNVLDERCCRVKLQLLHRGFHYPYPSSDESPGGGGTLGRGVSHTVDSAFKFGPRSAKSWKSFISMTRDISDFLDPELILTS
jgi:hypothetical protein